MGYSAEEKLLTMQKFAELVSRTNKTIYDVAVLCGHYPSTFHSWANADENLASIMQKSYLNRAYRYLKEAQEIFDELDCFWVDNLGNTKERHSAVNKAAHQVDNRYKWAGWLAPSLFGDNSKELKQIMKDMEEIKKRLAEDKK